MFQIYRRRLAPTMCVMALILASGGCRTNVLSIPPRGDLSEGGEITITPEESRVHRTVAKIIKDPEFAYFSLVFTDPATGAEHSLLISDAEAAILQPIADTRTLEIHLFVHREQTKSGDASRWDFVREDLALVKDDETVLVDRSVCERHRATMIRRIIPIEYGLPMREFMNDATRDFPHAAYELGGCVESNFSAKETYGYVCADCDAAYQKWTPPTR